MPNQSQRKVKATALNLGVNTELRKVLKTVFAMDLIVAIILIFKFKTWGAALGFIYIPFASLFLISLWFLAKAIYLRFLK